MDRNFYELFRTVSGAKPESVYAARDFFSHLGELDGGLFETAERGQSLIINLILLYSLLNVLSRSILSLVIAARRLTAE